MKLSDCRVCGSKAESGVALDVDDNNRGDSVMLRLAAYEDTGLGPEEIMKLKGETNGRT